MIQTFSHRLTGIPFEELDLTTTITSGQVFRWTREESTGAWRGVIEGGHLLRISQSESDSTIYWELTGEVADANAAETAVRRFLRLDDLRLAETAEAWCKADPHFAEAWRLHPGIRVLRQDPEECFFSFLCASVAPIARIASMLRGVAEECTGEPFGAFPTPAHLAEKDEETLRNLGLGFRAKRVAEAARRVANDLPAGFLRNLRTLPYAEAKRELMTFFGVGEKIADCVCLFSLDKDGAIPVDTHIWRMARNWYLPQLADGSLTPDAYTKVGAAFRDRFGEKAGWAQQTLFYRAAVGSKKR